MSSSEAEELMDQLGEDNRTYFDELMFGNKCLSILSDMKSFIELLFEKYENTFDSNDTHFYQMLVKEAEEVLQRDIGSDLSATIKTEDIDTDREMQTNFEFLSKSAIDSSVLSKSLNETSAALEALDCTPDAESTNIAIVERMRSSLSNKMLDNNNNNSKKSKTKKKIISLTQTCQNPVIFFGKQCDDKDIELPNIDDKSGTCGWPGCDFKAAKRGPLILHRISHRKHKFVCYWPNCGKGFAQRIHMETHYNAVHKKIKPFVCAEDGCTFRTAYKWELTLHANNKHSADGLKKYKCQMSGCDYATNYKTSIEVHMRTHTKDKPFMCQHSGCDLRFTSRQNLRNHIATHATELNYGCGQCGKRFKNKKNLGHHLRAKHKIRRR